LLDFIPRILMAEQDARRRALAFKVHVPHVPGFAWTMLQDLGLEDAVEEGSPTQAIYFDAVCIPLVTKLGPFYSTGFLRLAFDAFRAQLSSDPRERTSKLLVGRRKAPFAANFDTLADQLQREGFRLIYPEDFSLTEQIALFDGASVVVGEDGSAMHNIGFCRPGTHAVIFSRMQRCNYWHIGVSQQADCKMTYLLSDVEHESYHCPIDRVTEAALSSL
jgi:capsular polysaccharide biosynthesis protein